MAPVHSEDPVRLSLIIGSTREGRFGPTVARWFLRLAREHQGVEVDVIDLADTELPDRIVEESPLPAQVAELAPRLAEADAFVVITPEYNRSFPAPLKTAIDWFHEEWAAKPVGFVSYGGVSGGMHAVQHLRSVFAELRATSIRENVCFPNYWDGFDADGGWPKDARGSAEAAGGLLDELTWWARALRTHRGAEPLPS
ncbi:NADPH-dependent FMN reductase [Nocardiopsis metallicus]|uniref:NADPH-dependent FMN reductase n=1 Tax=Nocardiopsis metallicus TaxID=179819 RepID=UPI001607C7B5|nr:NAD(P)H-dependent oxidoreductase [Nocardiopsis metallicus]